MLGWRTVSFVFRLGCGNSQRAHMEGLPWMVVDNGDLHVHRKLMMLHLLSCASLCVGSGVEGSSRLVCKSRVWATVLMAS